jgi:hypothetical protein
MRIVVSVVIAACWTTITVQSFRPPPPLISTSARSRRWGGFGRIWRW